MTSIVCAMLYQIALPSRNHGKLFSGFLNDIAVVVNLCGEKRPIYYMMTICAFIMLLLCFALLFKSYGMFIAFSAFIIHGRVAESD